MLRIVNFCFLIILQVVIAEDFPPPQCKLPADVSSPGKCCKIPCAFNEADFEECGIPKRTENDQPFRRVPLNCDQQKCILNKYKLMKNDDEVDLERFAELLEKWATANPDYKDAIEMSKDICLKPELPGPKLSCAPTKILFCIKTVAFTNCPNWKDSDDCTKVKNQMEGCQEYFTN